MGAPFGLGILLLVVLPTVFTFAMSFYEYDLIRPGNFIGLANFTQLARDDVFWISLVNSLTFIAAAVPLRVLGALGLALLLHKRFRGAGAYRTAAYLPTIVPDVAYALLWLWILNPIYGPLNLALDAVGLPTFPWLASPDSTRAGIVLMSVFQLGEGFLVALATRQAVPAELYELASIEGAGAWTVFRRVTLPLMAPTLLLLVLRDTVFTFQASFVPALIVTGGGPAPYATTYLPLFIYRNAFEFLRYGYAAAATVIMFLITFVIVEVQSRIARRWRDAFVV
ncbi:MAG: sugar ABC transporter permease [Actinomycetota bacterium]|nr:sugar ABC transporter permease [Actinomycetota bacterium]